MISSREDIEHMRRGGKILVDILDLVMSKARVGVSPKDLDAFAIAEVARRGAKPAFLHFNGYPASLCVSRGSQIVHGLPTAKPFQEGELVSFDFGVLHEGRYTDAARTMIIGKGTAKQEKLIAVARDSFFEGMKKVKSGAFIGDLAHAIQSYVERHGFSVIRALVGHGVGASLHGDPRVPNFGKPGTGPILRTGMTIAVEPMIAAGKYDVVTDADGWTVSMADGSLSAHYENTIAVTESGYDILTKN